MWVVKIVLFVVLFFKSLEITAVWSMGKGGRGGGGGERERERERQRQRETEKSGGRGAWEGFRGEEVVMAREKRTRYQLLVNYPPPPQKKRKKEEKSIV